MHARARAGVPASSTATIRSGCTPCVACASGRSIERPPRRHVRITAVVQSTDRSVDHTTVRGSSRRRRRAVTATEKARCEKKQPSRRAGGLAGARARTHASWTRAPRIGAVKIRGNGRVPPQGPTDSIPGASAAPSWARNQKRNAKRKSPVTYHTGEIKFLFFQKEIQHPPSEKEQQFQRRPNASPSRS